MENNQLSTIFFSQREPVSNPVFGIDREIRRAENSLTHFKTSCKNQIQ